MLGNAVVVIGRPLGEDEYLIPVSYAALPSHLNLSKEFGPGHVSDWYDGRPFQKHASCVGMDETPGNRVFLVVHFDRKTKSEENIAEMDKLGYRPATHLEAYAFARAQPDYQRHFMIAALGSYLTHRDCQLVTLLSGNLHMRVFGCRCRSFSDEWHPDYRFLFVRK